MCTALKVLCVAEDRERLASLKRAAVSAEWELLAGAWDEREALRQLHDDRPHVLVVFGDLPELLAEARKAVPDLRILTDRDLPGTDVVVGSAAEVKEAALGRRSAG